MGSILIHCSLNIFDDSQWHRIIGISDGSQSNNDDYDDDDDDDDDVSLDLFIVLSLSSDSFDFSFESPNGIENFPLLKALKTIFLPSRSANAL